MGKRVKGKAGEKGGRFNDGGKEGRIKSREKGDGGLRVGHQVIMSGEYLSMINH